MRLLIVVLLAVSSRSFADERPNILLIVLDDAGYSDIGVFGGEIDTPNIDRLANGGIQFTQFHVTPNCSSKYKDKYLDGWDSLQRRRLESLKSHGLIHDNVEPQPRPEWIPAWESLSETEKRIAARDMAIYAGMIDRLDKNIGRLVERLKTLEKYENTLILVMSDNGPSKTTIAEYLELDGVGAAFLRRFDNKIDNRGLPGSNVDLGPGWAYGLAAPLRLMKGYQSQGAASYPDRVRQLSDRWNAYASDNGVVEPDTPTFYAKPPS